MNSMPRCYVPPAGWGADGIVLPPVGESHHLSRVLRLRPGARVRLFDGLGREGDGLLEPGAGPPRIRLEREWTRPAPAARLVLFQAVLKGEAMDAVVRKSVELGASSVVPLETARVVARAGAEKAAARRARWAKIAIEAARQCGIARLPALCETMTVEAAIREWPGLDAVFLGSLEPGAEPLLAAARPFAARSGAGLGLLVGPEGDWTPDEHARFRAAGARPVGFGDNVLRADTAACYGLSVLGALVTEAAGTRLPVPPA